MKIITVHGIRTRTSPFAFLDASKTLADRSVTIEHFRYGFMSIPKFANPWARKRVLADFLKFYDERIGFGERPSAACHSFGTWILTEAIQTFPEIRFEKVIFFGSILSPELDLGVFFDRDQVRELRHEVGRRDWIVPFSRVVLGENAGKSGQVGFSDRRRKYRTKVTETFYERFAHSSAAFLNHHIEEVWAPYLLEQPFKVRQRILGADALAWMQKPPPPEGLSFPKRTYYCRIDRLGNYFARYGAIAQNTSTEPIDRIPIHVATSSSETLANAQFTVVDENLRRLAFDSISDEPHKKKVEIPIGSLPPQGTYQLSYYFRVSKAFNYSGDIDFFDIRKSLSCEIEINSFYRLSGSQAFTMRSDRLIDRIPVKEEQQQNQTYSYFISHENKVNDDGILFYFEGFADEEVRMKFAYRTNLKKAAGAATIEVRNIREDEVTALGFLERMIEGRERRATPAQLMERVRMFPDGFIVALAENQIVGYIESVLWASRNFNTFEDIRRFPLFVDLSGDELYIIFVATDNAWRRRGIASALLEACKAVARQLGASNCTLVAKDDLVLFYEKRGFGKIRELPGFLDETGGILMSCPL